jgi:WD40 repeat protein
VQVFDSLEGTPLYSLLGATAWLQTAAFSPDGRSLAVSGLDGRVLLWRVADGVPWKELEGAADDETTSRPIYAVSALAYSRDGNRLAGGTVDGTVRLWDATSGRLLRTLHDAAGQGGSDSTAAGRTLLFTSDGMVLTAVYTATSGYRPLVRVDDGRILASLVELAAAQVRLPSVNSVAFSPFGLLLAAGSEDNGVWLWRTDSGTSLGRLEGHQGPVRAVAFSPDGELLASASNDRTVRLWRAAVRSSLLLLSGHLDGVRGVAFSPDGKTLASASADGTVRLWQVADGTLARVLATKPAQAVAFSPDGQLLAVGLADGSIQLWRVTDGTPQRVLVGHTLPVLSVAFSSDGTLLVTTSHDGTVRLWGVRP